MKIRNRSASVVVYRVPDLHVRRRFAPGEIKDVPAEELKQLAYTTGGREILTHYLQVSQDDLPQIGIGEQEQEYFYSDEDIQRIMTIGSVDEFLDVLDFAPEGVLNLIKKYALTLPLTDLYKINALKEKTGFDVTKAMEHSTEDDTVFTAVPARKRRVETPAVESKYKVISDN